MSDKSYEQMTHDEIIRVHGERYSHMTPDQKLEAAAEAKERLRRYYTEQKELDSPRNKKLSEVTLGEIMDELGTVADKVFNRIALFIVIYIAYTWIVKHLGWMH